MTSQGGQHFFSGAKNVAISGGIFASVTSPSKSIRFGLSRLLENISQGAFHNAAERGTPPRCHPHTRIAIRAEIMEWVKAPSSMRKLILWMYGPAGAGKTAIAQSIAEECDKQGLLAASFFFWRTAAGRNDASKFVATLAYQLSRHIPQIEDPLFTAIEQDPAIFSRSLSTQMEVLVITPLAVAAPSLSTPIFVIVDGFDECGPDGQSQSDLLHLLGTVASELQQIPLILLIASRPEYEIREAFNADLLSPFLKVLVLDNSYKPDEDIKHYFDSIFRKIRREHCRLGRRLPSPWPTADAVDSLVSKASGQFIFAATVLKFIDSPRHDPADRLNIILHLSSVGNETPFALLDALYCFILDSVIDIEKVLSVLTFLLLAGEQENNLTLDHLEELLTFEVRSVLVDMHSLVYVPPPGDKKLPRMYHASLGDFLLDRFRSRDYYIDAHQGHIYLCRLWLNVLGIHPQSRTIRNAFALNRFTHRHHHYLVGGEILDDLGRFDLSASLEGISDFERDLRLPDWTRFFECVKNQGQNWHRLDIFPRLQNDFDAFIFNRIAKYPHSVRTHIPILLCPQVHPGSVYIFEILLRGASKSMKEWDELKKLDNKLLGILTTVSDTINLYFGNFFQDKARAGKHVVDGRSHVALVGALVSGVYTMLEETDQSNRHWIKEIATNSDRPYFSGFARLLERTPIDLDLAWFLSERTLQFKKDMPELKHIAKPSMKYIQRCGLPFLEHTHQLDMDECIICLEFNDASVVAWTERAGRTNDSYNADQIR